MTVLKKHINDWFDYITHRLTPETVNLYMGIIDRYNQSVTQFPPNANELEKYITALAAHRKARTVNSHLTAIKSFYRWAEKQGLDNISKPIEFLKESPSKTRCLSEQEYELILQFSTGNLHKAIQFLGNTGVREAEFRKITWHSFSPDYQFVRIDGKGRKRREVPLNGVCRAVLASPQIGDQPDFILTYRRPHSIYFRFGQLAERVKIERFGPHALRHFFATRLIRAKVPLPIVSRILGHANCLITERCYLHLCPADLQVTDCLRF